MHAVLIVAFCAVAPPEQPQTARVTGIKAVCRNGQTFVTWKDVAEGEAGAAFRYALYQSNRPITQDTLARAELCYKGVLNNSAKLFGSAFRQKGRQDPNTPVYNVWEGGKLVPKTTPTFTIEEGGRPLPMWSGLAVRTVTKGGKSYYAVVATDLAGESVSRIEPGRSATTEPLEEKVAPIQPTACSRSRARFERARGRWEWVDSTSRPVWEPVLPVKLGDSKVRGRWARSTSITGKKGLPLHLSLHGSQSRGGGAGDHGDFYVYFGTPEMGWRDGLPGVFTVVERRGKEEGALSLAPRDCIENPTGNGVIETCWFGYFCVPHGAAHKEPRAYPFSERRLARMVNWVIEKYHADPERVYSAGQSMGGMGSTQFSFRHPEIFAAVYPRLGRVRQTWLPAVGPGLPTSINKGRWTKPAPMDDGTTDYFDRMDSVKYVREHHEDLPFYGFACGRRDWVEPWKSQIEMVEALTAGHHGFTLSWNNGGHDSVGARAARAITKYYPAGKFARNKSYPAFGNSSINDEMGNGDPKDGDLEGGINLGFIWGAVIDEPDQWSVKLSNELAQAEMTVDVTPRRCQKFKPKAGETFQWTNAAGGSGQVVADRWDLVTVNKVRIKPAEATVLTITRVSTGARQAPSPARETQPRAAAPQSQQAVSPVAGGPSPSAVTWYPPCVPTGGEQRRDRRRTVLAGVTQRGRRCGDDDDKSACWCVDGAGGCFIRRGGRTGERHSRWRSAGGDLASGQMADAAGACGGGCRRRPGAV